MSETPISNFRAFAFLLSYIKRHRLIIIAGIALLMAVDTLQLFIPRFIKKILDTLGEKTFSHELIIKYALIIVGFAVIMTVLRFLYRLCIFLPSRIIETKMRDDLLTHMTALSFSYFNSAKTGDLMALLINDLNAVRMATGPALIGLTDALFMGVLSLAFMLAINVKLTLVTIIPLPLILFIMIRFGGLLQSKFAAVQESFGGVSSHAQEAFSGIRVIKGFAQETAEITHFTAQCNEYVAKNISLVKLWGMFFPLITLLASVAYSLLYLLGGKQTISGQLTLGDFVSFAFYIQMFVWPITAIGWVFNIFQRGVASVKRVMNVLDTRSDIVIEFPKRQAPAALLGSIDIRDLSFSYPGSSREVLRNISISIPQGSTLGIVGKPGSGKTTLVSLLFHLFPIRRGCVFIDNTDISDLPLDVLRAAIGYVPQDSFLFSDTIANNIGFGMRDSSRRLDAIRRYGAMASIDREIETMPLGYETVVGERGITLSGGQKQRVAIARALVLRRPILILDDALSAVDSATERSVASALREETRGTTTIIIAHRISTVMQCDNIIVLDNGAISEQGTHERLASQNGFYARLYTLQKLQLEKQ